MSELLDFIRCYLRETVEETGVKPSPSLDRWYEQQTDAMHAHMLRAVEAFAREMPFPPSEDES